jgi:hypothetical protein
MGGETSCCKTNEIVPSMQMQTNHQTETNEVPEPQPNNQIHIEDFSNVTEFTMTIKKTNENDEKFFKYDMNSRRIK